MKCPICGDECTRDEADIGVGTLYGAARCDNCGWFQEILLDDYLEAE